MRYEFVGKKTQNVGKTLWEILGNLKNFGVGRLIKKSVTTNYPELSFFKVVKVQALPPPKNEFLNRNVLVWIDEIYRNRKLEPQKYTYANVKAKFQLIPKEEEPIYLEELEKLEPPVRHVMKYCSWPPLYKILWEKETTEDKKYGPIPKLKNMTSYETGVVIHEEDKELKKCTSSLYKGEHSVEEMYKEIVRLKLLINANSNANS